MAKYVYPAIFTKEKNGMYSVEFPDIENCYTGGDDMSDALEMAEDVLCLTLYDMEQDGRAIPLPSEYKTVKTNSKDIITLIGCDTDFYRRFNEKKSVKKTLTIPMYLNERAELAGINFSATLQAALKQELHLV